MKICLYSSGLARYIDLLERSLYAILCRYNTWVSTSAQTKANGMASIYIRVTENNLIQFFSHLKIASIQLFEFRVRIWRVHRGKWGVRVIVVYSTMKR